ADALDLGAVLVGCWRGKILRCMRAAAEVGELRPPFLRPRGFGEAADIALQRGPHRARILLTIRAGLDEPGRRVLLERSDGLFSHPIVDPMTGGHLDRDVESLSDLTFAEHGPGHPPIVPVRPDPPLTESDQAVVRQPL